MIVDDSRDTCETMALLLKKAGHEATWVSEGREAIGHVLNEAPDIILLDLLMPEMDGPSFLEVVRSYLRIQSVPVIILTAITEGPLIERTKKLNVHSILVKGKSTGAEVLQAIEQALAK